MSARNHFLCATRINTGSRLLGLLLFAGVGSGLFGQDEIDTSELPPPHPGLVDYATEIKPILQEHCYRCHSGGDPEGGFRIDNRLTALEGTEYGPVIFPGDSENSPLIHYVARLIPNWEMPPIGKGDPLKPFEIALLRAWIDQGADFGEDLYPPLQHLKYEVEPVIGAVTVDGDESKFRELTGMREGGVAGIRSFRVTGTTENNTGVFVEGRLLSNPHDYRLSAELHRPQLGWVGLGYQEYRKYDDTSGGYFPQFGMPVFELDRELAMDVGRAWVEFGLSLPDWPVMSVRYDHQYREGEQSSTQWGPVGPPTRNIVPSFKEVNEEVHRLTFNVSYEIDRWQLEEEFQAEWYDLNTTREQVTSWNVNKAGPNKFTTVDETTEWFQGANTFRVEKWIREWWMIGGGHLYSFLDGTAAFDQNSFLTGFAAIPPVVNFIGFGNFPDRFTDSNRIVMEQKTHVLSLSSMVQPWNDLTLTLGGQAEWIRQKGFSDFNLRLGTPDPVTGKPPGFPFEAFSDIDRNLFEEHAGLRYTGIPLSTVYAEASWLQEDTGHFEEQTFSGNPNLLRNTDATADRQKYRAGYRIAPWRILNANAYYQFAKRNNRYHPAEGDQSFGAQGFGYPGFIERREIEGDEIGAELSVRPWGSLRTTFRYQYLDSDYRNWTRELVSPATPAGWVHSGQYEADVFSVLVSGNVLKNLFLTATAVYSQSTTETFDNGSAAVANYDGDVLSVMTGLRYALNERTSLNVWNTLSLADYAQDNFAAGLPLGTEYTFNQLQAGLSRQLNETLTLNLQYLLADYSEDSSGGFNDFTAHGILASLNWTWE